jgi:mannose-1-phosphate guanylyltransferase
MKAVIFAGGIGTRLWPLSRRKSPKQFEKIIGNKSTLQLAAYSFSRISGGLTYIYLTGKSYQSIIRDQLAELPPRSYIRRAGSPRRRARRRPDYIHIRKTVAR